MSSYIFTASQLFLPSCASRLAVTTWRTLVDVDIAVRLPTKRGSPRGSRKQSKINSVIGHRPPKDRPHTRSNNNLIQVPTVSRDSAVIVDKSKYGLINVRSLQNKSLFARNYVDECSLDIVARTEPWLTDEDTTYVSELRSLQLSFTSRVEALDAVGVSEFCSAKLSSSYPVSLSTPAPQKHSPPLYETPAPAAQRM